MTQFEGKGFEDSSSGVKRAHNFNAGPAVLPLPVLQQAQAEFLDFHGAGMSLVEMSHRSKEFDAVILKAEEDLRRLLDIPANYKILFQQGGASLQFAMLPMNLRAAGTPAEYLVHGSWSQAAVKEAKKLGSTRVVASTEGTNFDRLPKYSASDLDPDAAYLHYTSNETIHGNEWNGLPTHLPGVPLACDMSSNFLSRPVDVSRYGLIYAGAQKNAGPSGVTLVIVREDLLERVPANLPAMLDYRLQADKGSMYNTPPTFAIYMVGLVFQWLLNLGGLAEIEKHNIAKSDLIYRVIDAAGGFYQPHAQRDSRSRMNITFRLESEALEEQFVKQAKQNGMIGLKGHRSVGGLRASMYNALPLASAQALADFMGEFQRANG